MHRFPALFVIVVLAGVSVLLLANHALAVGRPAFAGNGNPGFSRENHPTHEMPARPTSAMHAQSNNNATSSSERKGARFRQLGGRSSEGSPSSRMPAFANHHLQGNKLNACQSVQKSLTNRSTHLVSLVTNMEEKFTSIAKGVEQYYLNQVVPTGKTLPSYDNLVATITTKQNALTPLVAAAQSDVTNFSCTGNNPGAQMTQYRTDMQAVIKGLQDYRTAIRNLIVSVRTLPSISVAPTAETSASPSLVPSTQPSSSVSVNPSGAPTPTVFTPSVTQ